MARRKSRRCLTIQTSESALRHVPCPASPKMKPSLVCLLCVGLSALPGLEHSAAETKNEPAPGSIQSEKAKNASVAAVVDVASLRAAAKIGDAKARIPVRHEADVVGGHRFRLPMPVRLPQDPIRWDAGR